MKTTTINLYTYAELSKEAKERALKDWNENTGSEMPFLEEDIKDTCLTLLTQYGIVGDPSVRASF